MVSAPAFRILSAIDEIQGRNRSNTDHDTSLIAFKQGKGPKFCRGGKTLKWLITMWSCSRQTRHSHSSFHVFQLQMTRHLSIDQCPPNHPMENNNSYMSPSHSTTQSHPQSYSHNHNIVDNMAIRAHSITKNNFSPSPQTVLSKLDFWLNGWRRIGTSGRSIFARSKLVGLMISG